MNKLSNYLLFSILDYIELGHLIIVAVLFAMIIAILFIFRSKIKGNKRFIKQQIIKENSIREFRIDLLRGTCSYFDIEKPSSVINIPIQDFYKSFGYSDQEELKRWLDSLIRRSGNPEKTFERFVINKSFKTSVLVIYKFVKANYDQKVLYLESKIYPSIRKSDITKGSETTFSNLDKLSTHFNEMKKSKKKNICAYIIHLYPHDNIVNKDSNEKRHIYLLDLLNKYLVFIKKNLYVFFYDKSSLCIVTTKNKKTNKIKNYSNQLIENTNTYLALHSLNKLLDYKIGIYLSKKGDQETLKSIVEKAYNAALFAKESTSSNKQMYYNSEIENYETYYQTLVKETRNLLKNNNFKTYYQPYVPTASNRLSSSKTRGYIVTSNPNSDIIDDTKTIENIVSNENESYTYVKLLINNAIAGFEDPNIKKSTSKNIIMKIRLPFLKDVIHYFKYNTLDDFVITFVIDEFDFISSNYAKEEIIDDFNKIKISNQQIAINIQNYNFDLDPDIIKNVDSILIDESLTSNVLDDTRSRILSYDLINNIKSMRKQILAQGIKSWAHGELLTTYGISYFTGPLISKKSDSVKEINKKITQKIQEFETKK